MSPKCWCSDGPRPQLSQHSLMGMLYIRPFDEVETRELNSCALEKIKTRHRYKKQVISSVCDYLYYRTVFGYGNAALDSLLACRMAPTSTRKTRTNRNMLPRVRGLAVERGNTKGHPSGVNGTILPQKKRAHVFT